MIVISFGLTQGESGQQPNKYMNCLTMRRGLIKILLNYGEFSYVQTNGHHES